MPASHNPGPAAAVVHDWQFGSQAWQVFVLVLKTVMPVQELCPSHRPAPFVEHVVQNEPQAAHVEVAERRVYPVLQVESHFPAPVVLHPLAQFGSHAEHSLVMPLKTALDAHLSHKLEPEMLH